MSDNFKKIVDQAGPVAKDDDINMDVPDSSNLVIGLPPVRKIQESPESQEDDDPKCKVCNESLKESAQVMKTLPGMWGNKVGSACAFCLFGLKSG